MAITSVSLPIPNIDSKMVDNSYTFLIIDALSPPVCRAFRLPCNDSVVIAVILQSVHEKDTKENDLQSLAMFKSEILPLLPN